MHRPTAWHCRLRLRPKLNPARPHRRLEVVPGAVEVALGRAPQGALIGLGIEGEEGFEAGAAGGAKVADEQGVHVFDDAEHWDVLEEIPNDSAAALLLIEHHWAVPLRDAIAKAGGFRVSDGFISPLDLVAIGLVTAEEAEKHAAVEKEAVAS